MSRSLSFIDLRLANSTRQNVWDPGSDITLEYRGNELAGEVGEAVENVVDLLQLSISTGRMANIVKKLARERLGLRGSRATKEDLAKELADIVICTDLLAMHARISLGEAVRDKFNETSEKVGLPTRLP